MSVGILPYFTGPTEDLLNTRFVLLTSSDGSTVGELELLEGKILDRKFHLQDVIIDPADILAQAQVTQPNKYSVFFLQLAAVSWEKYSRLLSAHKLRVGTMSEFAPLKMKRKINKKIILTKMNMIIDPELQELLDRSREPTPCCAWPVPLPHDSSSSTSSSPTAAASAKQLLLPQLFNGLPFDKVHKIIYGVMDCTVKADQPAIVAEKNKRETWATLPKRIAVTYRDALDYWNNCLFTKIPFMSENRGTVYEVIPIEEKEGEEGRKGGREGREREGKGEGKGREREEREKG